MEAETSKYAVSRKREEEWDRDENGKEEEAEEKGAINCMARETLVATE